MSLIDLRNRFIGQLPGPITVDAAAFTASGLQPPPTLDALIGAAFTDVTPAAGLALTTSAGQIGAIQQAGACSTFVVTGTIGVSIAKGAGIQATFTACGNQGSLVIDITLVPLPPATAWTFSTSFPTLGGKSYDALTFTAPHFFFAGQAETAVPWNGTTVALSPGLNFAGAIALSGYLGGVADLLEGFQIGGPYVMSGTVDPSLMTRTNIAGQKSPYPGLTLQAPLASTPFPLGANFTIGAPRLLFTLADFGPEAGLAPSVALAADLTIPGGGVTKPEARTQLSALSDTSYVAFDLITPHGGLIISIEQVFSLMGATWFGRFPPALSSLFSNIGLKAFGIVLRKTSSGLAIDSVEAIVGSGTPWKVIDDPKYGLELGISLDWTIHQPFTSSAWQYSVLTADARFMPKVIPGTFEFSIDSNLVVSGGYLAKDESEYVNVNDLVNYITDAIVLPKTFVEAELHYFWVVIDQPNRRFALSTEATIDFPIAGDVFQLKDVTFDLSVQKPLPGSGSGAATQYTAEIGGTLIVGPLHLQTNVAYDAGVWNASVAMEPGTTLVLQDLINAIFAALQLPQNLFDVGLTISGVSIDAMIPTAAGESTTYTASGVFDWKFSLLGLSVNPVATVTLNYDASQTPAYSGSVSAVTKFSLFGASTTFTLGYAIQPGTGGPTTIISIAWEGLTCEYDTSAAGTKLIFTADDTWNLGRLIGSLLRLIDPYMTAELPPPWDLLNSVSLGGLKIEFDSPKTGPSTVSVTFPLNIELFFGTITGLTITKTGGQVQVSLDGNFVFNDGKPVAWDAAKGAPPEVPGGGKSAFDLRLLAAGQRVTVPGLQNATSVADAVGMLAGFAPQDPGSDVVPVGGGGEAALTGTLVTTGAPQLPVFAADSNWLIGTHFFALSNTIELHAIFNDPVLYGLAIGLSGEKAKIFDGLQFEILYKKISDSVGVYKVTLQLPDAMRYLQFGAVTVILPVVSVSIYTNGNFLIDFGFPYNMDFSRSFTVQAFPFTGAGGFYFGVLDGTTSTQVPQNVTCGTFKPVIEFGIGVNLGLGKTINYGILSAEISVTAYGIVQGVIGAWHAYSTASALLDDGGRLLGSGETALTAAGGPDPGAETAYYYKITGTIGLIGIVSGTVNFAIIQAEVNLTVFAQIAATFEAYRSTLMSIDAGVSVSVSLKIDFGLFSITIHFSFSVRVHESFTIGPDHPQDAPWYCGGQTRMRPALRARHGGMLLSAPALKLASAPDFSPLATPATGKAPLVVYFFPHLSIAATGGEPTTKAAQQAVYAINLFVSNEPVPGQTYQSFERLMRDTFLWVVSSFSGAAGAKGTPDAELLAPATSAQIAAAVAYFQANADGRALNYTDIGNNLTNLFLASIQLPPKSSANPPDVAAFPMVPQFELDATFGSTTLADVNFTTFSTVGDEYIADVQRRIDKLIAKLLTALERDESQQQMLHALRAAPAVNQSIAQLIFVDYFTLTARTMLQSAADSFKAYSYPLQKGDSVASIVTAFNTAGNSLTAEEVAWANRGATVAAQTLTLTGVPYVIQATDTWGSIASANGIDPGTMAADNAAVTAVLVAGASLTIGAQTHPVPRDGSIAATAVLFGMQPAAFGAAIAATPNLLAALTTITLNGVACKVPAGQTLSGVAEIAGLTIAQLTPSIAGVANLFDVSASATISLPGLAALTNQRLWDALVANNVIRQASGMASRFLLGGLRLPTAGVTFADANAAPTEDTAGLQALTGQQIVLPPLGGYDPKAQPLTLALSVAAGQSVPWTTFVNPNNPQDSSTLAYTLSGSEAVQATALVAQATATPGGLQAPITAISELPLVQLRARRYAFQNNIILQSAAPLPLPKANDNLPANVTRRPRIWQFPSALQAELSRTVALAPRFTMQIGSATTEGGPVVASPAQSFAFGTLINVTLRRFTAPSGQAAASATTYELVGADQAGVNLLENLLIALNGRPQLIDGIFIVYPPNQASSRAEGVQYDGADNYTAFLVQANLSTETNPPAQTTNALRAAAGPPRGLLDDFATFAGRLWSGSIVRSGGYYFVYERTAGVGLPDAAFNDHGVATIAVLITYKPQDNVSGAQGGTLQGFMNVAVIDDPVDPTNDIVFAQAESRSATVSMAAAGNPSLQAIADQYHLGPIEIAEANLSQPLSTSANVLVTDIVHQVGRGETLAQIASTFKTSPQQIQAINPNVDFQNLATGTGLHIPAFTTQPSASGPGLTLPQIAASFDTTVAALAWANAGVPGLYDPSVTLTFSDQLLDAQATLTAGNIGLTVTRSYPGDDTTQPAIYLEQQYQLLGYDVLDNTDCTPIADSLPLPSGPANDESAEDLADHPKPKLMATAEPWQYKFVVPAARAARNNPVPPVTDSSYPDAAMNPYAGAGGFVQLGFDWRDMLGNRTWSPFDDPSPQNTYPLNGPPSRLGFNDGVIGLGQWPSTRPDHYFQSPSQLVIEWTFDPGRYSTAPIGGKPSPWEENAKTDQQMFASVFYQLVQTAPDGTPATIVESLTSLAGGAGQPITDAEAAAVQAYVLAAWRFLVFVLANNGTPPSKDAWPQQVQITRTIDPSLVTDITPVDASLRFRRLDAVVLADFRDDDTARQSVTVIPAALKPDTAGKLVLDWYAMKFEAAFSAANRQLLLASGVARGENSGGGATTLWAVPLGKAAGVPYQYQFSAVDQTGVPVATFFAPPPLSTALISRPGVTVYTFDPDTGLSATPNVTKTFTDVDLDLWARGALGAFDALLSPQFAVPAYLVDNKSHTSNLKPILDTKGLLAAAIAATVTNVLTSPALDPVSDKAKFAAASEVWRQQMLMLLQNAYAVDTAVQYALSVTSPADPGTIAVAPRIYGSPADPAGTAARDYAVTSFKVPLVNGPSLLTYAFTARNPARQKRFDLSLQYAPSNIEHEIADVPGVDGYQASSWLSMLDPLPPVPVGATAVTTVPVSIPVLDRSYPTPPALRSQTFVQPGQAAAGDLAQAKQWTFRFTYSQAHVAQDQIDAVTLLNVPQGQGLKGTDADDPDLFTMLARIQDVLPQLLDTFAASLQQIDVATDVTSQPFVRAKNAVAAFNTLTSGLDRAWASWTPPPPPTHGLLKGAAGDVQPVALPFSILEDSIEQTADGKTWTVLRVTIAYPSSLPTGIDGPPMVTFDGYTPQPVSPEIETAATRLKTGTMATARAAVARFFERGGLRAAPDDIQTAAWIYAKINPQPTDPPFLEWDAAIAMPERRVDLAGLDAIQYQNAWTSVSIVRNLHLIPGNITRDPFVYRTPLVQFPSKLTPLLDSSAEVDVASVPTGTAQNRALADHLAALFSAFFAGSPSQQQLTKLEVRYRYAVSASPGAPFVELPVRLLPPAKIATAGDPLTKTMAGLIKDWFTGASPSTESASFVFDLSTFSSLSNNTLPLVRVRDLNLMVENITDVGQ